MDAMRRVTAILIMCAAALLPAAQASAQFPGFPPTPSPASAPGREEMLKICDYEEWRIRVGGLEPFTDLKGRCGWTKEELLDGGMALSARIRSWGNWFSAVLHFAACVSSGPQDVVCGTSAVELTDGRDSLIDKQTIKNWYQWAFPLYARPTTTTYHLGRSYAPERRSMINLYARRREGYSMHPWSLQVLKHQDGEKYGSAPTAQMPEPMYSKHR